MARTRIALIALAIAAASTAVIATPATASGAVYAFRLMTPNTAAATEFDEHHLPGDWIRITGSGEFDPATGWVEGSGSFTHYREDGTVQMRGTWEATGFVGFTPFPGPTPGMLGGVLELTVQHFDQSGAPCDCMGSGGAGMTVTSDAYAPAGTDVETGTTMGPFQDPTGGRVGFSVVQE